MNKLTGALLYSTLLLTCSSLIAPTAVEITAKSNEANVYNALLNTVNQRLEALRQEFDLKLAEERDARMLADSLMEADIDQLQLAVTDLKTRVNVLELDLAELETRMTTAESGLAQLRTQITQLRADVGTLNNRLASEVARLDGRITTTNSKVTENTRDINTLVGNVIELRSSISTLTRLMTDLDARLHALAACVANGSCVGRTPPQLVTTTFRAYDIWNNNHGTWGAGMYVWNSGVSYQEYPYCALVGAINLDGNDFFLERAGPNGTWRIRMEDTNWQTESIEAICFKIV